MIDNELQVRLLHAAKTQDQWKAVTSYPKKGEVCLEAINTSGATAFKIKIGDGTRPYCRNTGTAQNPVWDFTSDQVLPYFGSVIETSGSVGVVAISTYDTTKKKLSFYNLSLTATTSGGSTTLTPTIGVTPYLEVIEGNGISFTTDETGTVKEFYINVSAVGGNKIDVTTSSGNIVITHEDIDTTATDVASTITTDSSSTVSEKELNVITGISVDAQGHITHIDKDVSTNLVAADIKAPVTVSDDSMWSFRTTAKDVTIIGEDNGSIDKLKGKTLKWQQMVQNGNFSNGTTNWQAYETGTTLSAADNILSITNPTGAAYFGALTVDVPIVNGHKYYVKFDAKSSASTTVYNMYFNTNVFDASVASYTSLTTEWKSFSRIFESKAAGQAGIGLRQYYNSYGSELTLYMRNCKIFDLTEMFGSGNEPSTAAEFEAMYPLDYYAYTSTPVLINNAASGIKTTGFNQWDEQWEVGAYSTTTGGKTVDNARIRAKNKIPIFPSTNYYFRIPYNISLNGYYVFWYDANKNFIRSEVKSTSSITSPSNAYYLTFCTQPVYGTTYKNDICLNLSWSGYRNGEYEPYEEHTLYFNGESGSLATITGKKLVSGVPTGESVTIFPEGMKSVGTVYDFGKADSDGYIRKVTKRLGVVDLGDLTWVFGGSNPRFISSAVSDKKEGIFNVLCAKYITNNSPIDLETNVDKTICGYNGSKNIYVRDFAYTDADTFKTAMSGVMCYYELATPEEYLLDTPIPANYIVNDFGTEERLPNDINTTTGVPLSTPFTGIINYKSNFKDSVIQLIETVNNYKNPVQGIDNTLQTVGKLAVYDSNHTTASSTYSASNATIVEGATGNNIILPSVEALVTYVNSKLSSALTYKGTIDEWSDLPTSGQSVGDMYIASAQFTEQGTTYNAGDFFIWNGSSWDIVSGTTSVINGDVTLAMDGSEYTLGTIDGVDITVTTPNLDFSDPTANGNTIDFIDTVSQTDGLISATKKTVRSASTSQTGVVQLSSGIESTSSEDSKVPTAYETLGSLDLRDVGVGSLTSDGESTPSYKGTLHKRFDNSGTWTSQDFYPITKLWAISGFDTDFATAYPDLDAIEDVTGTGFLQKTSNGWSLSTETGKMKWLDESPSSGTYDYSTAPTDNEELGSFVHNYYGITEIQVAKLGTSPNQTNEGFRINIPILTSASATSGKVLKGITSSLPTWGKVALEELDELDNLGSSVGYLKRKAGSVTGTYEWELSTPDSTTVDTIYNDGTSVSDNTTNAGIKVTTNGTTTTHKLPFSAIVNDASTGNSAVVIILNGNFS